MHKRFRRAAAQLIIADNSSSDNEEIGGSTQRPLIRRRSINLQKYGRTRRKNNMEIDISDTSTSSEEQENSKRMSNPKRYKDNNRTLPLTPQNKFQPLAVALSASAKQSSSSPIAPSSELDTSNISNSTPTTTPTTCRAAAWQSLKKTLSTLRQERRGVLQTTMLNCSYQEALEGSFIECTPSPSIEANLRTMSQQQQLPKSGAKSAAVKAKRRCIRGGYLHEYMQLMQKERMDRRSLAHNRRLGISSGNRVDVLGISVSFGIHMARVQAQDVQKGIFNVIVPLSMVSKICIGSSLELHFDLELQTALHLPNKEPVYVQPNKVVLL